jgi:hypothetical protein
MGRGDCSSVWRSPAIFALKVLRGDLASIRRRLSSDRRDRSTASISRVRLDPSPDCRPSVRLFLVSLCRCVAVSLPLRTRVQESRLASPESLSCFSILLASLRVWFRCPGLTVSRFRIARSFALAGMGPTLRSRPGMVPAVMAAERFRRATCCDGSKRRAHVPPRHLMARKCTTYHSPRHEISDFTSNDRAEPPSS